MNEDVISKMLGDCIANQESSLPLESCPYQRQKQTRVRCAQLCHRICERAEGHSDSDLLVKRSLWINRLMQQVCFQGLEPEDERMHCKLSNRVTGG